MTATMVPDVAARMRDLLRGSSIELSARDKAGEELLRTLLQPGTCVHVNHAPTDTHHGIVAAAARIRRAGCVPVPHIAARYLASFTQLNDYLARAGEAAVDRVFLVAGDLDRPVGPFGSSLDVLATGLLQRHGIGRVGFAGYPEGHPKLGLHELDAALEAKLALARQWHLDAFIVTQFSFDAAPIAAWIARARSQGVRAPIQVGLAGPASVASLAKFALRCGVRASLQALAAGHASIARLMVEAGPEPVIRALAADPIWPDIAGLHFFTFGGFTRTARWLREAAATPPNP